MKRSKNPNPIQEIETKESKLLSEYKAAKANRERLQQSAQEVYQQYIEQWLQIKQIEGSQEALIAYLVRKGNLSAVELILNQEPALRVWRSREGHYLTHIAAYYNRLKIFKFLIASYSDLAVVNNCDNNSPGWIAALSGNYQILMISRKIIQSVITTNTIVELLKGLVDQIKNIQLLPAFQTKYKKTLICLLNEKPGLLTQIDVTNISILDYILTKGYFELLSELLDSCPLQDINWNEIKLNDHLPLFKNAPDSLKELKYIVKFLPFLLTIKNNSNENLLHLLIKEDFITFQFLLPGQADFDAKQNEQKDEEKSAIFYRKYENLEKLDLIIKHSPAELIHGRNQYKRTPVQLAVHLLDKEFKRGSANGALEFLCYAFLTKLNYKGEDSVFDFVKNTIEVGIIYFLPIYWYLLFVPVDCPHSMPKELVHLFLEYFVEHPIQKILLMVLGDSKNQKAQNFLSEESVKFLYSKHSSFLSSSAAASISCRQIISMIVQDEYKTHFQKKSVALFSQSGQSCSSTPYSYAAKSPAAS